MRLPAAPALPWLGLLGEEEFGGAALSCRVTSLKAQLRRRLGFLLDVVLAQVATCGVHGWVLMLRTP